MWNIYKLFPKLFPTSNWSTPRWLQPSILRDGYGKKIEKITIDWIDFDEGRCARPWPMFGTTRPRWLSRSPVVMNRIWILIQRRFFVFALSFQHSPWQISKVDRIHLSAKPWCSILQGLALVKCRSGSHFFQIVFWKFLLCFQGKWPPQQELQSNNNKGENKVEFRNTVHRCVIFLKLERQRRLLHV